MSIFQLLADLTPTATRPAEPIPWYANPQDMLVLLIFGMLMYLFFGSQRSKKKEQQLRDDMLRNMKRGDRVVTAGGIIGTLVDVRDADVVLKVDESSNTKIKFTREAIKRVVTEDESATK
ncbi:MAG: preprotein translocase subunit YajC [Tepidisphaeraceae bacterium]